MGNQRMISLVMTPLPIANVTIRVVCGLVNCRCALRGFHSLKSFVESRLIFVLLVIPEALPGGEHGISIVKQWLREGYYTITVKTLRSGMRGGMIVGRKRKCRNCVKDGKGFDNKWIHLR